MVEWKVQAFWYGLITVRTIFPMDELMEPLTCADANDEADHPQSRPNADGSHADSADVPPQSHADSGPRWRPVRVRVDQVSVEGGYSTLPHIVESITLCDPEKGSETFIKICKHHQWFMRMAAGKDIRKGQLRCVDVLDEMREKVDYKLGLGGFGEDEAAEEDEPAVADLRPDPMDALADAFTDSQDLHTPRKGKPPALRPRRHRSSALKSGVMVVNMRPEPLCVDPSSTATHPVRVYLAGATKKELWVHIESLPWVVKYTADQIRLQGVVAPAVAEEAIEHMRPNCSRVPNLRVDWNFHTKEWDGKFVQGPCKGVKRAMPPSSLTAQGWEALQFRDMISHDSTFWKAAKAVKREAAKMLLSEWCASIAEGTEAEFEATCGLNTAVAADESAVAAAPP